MPGVGAQGGDVEIAVRAALDANGGGLLVAPSRSVIYADRQDFERGASDAARRIREAANAARSAAGVR